MWRDRSRATVIGITGTAGKTTVKEALSSILSKVGKTAKNPVNNNNQIGMPCAILNIDGDERFWVIEVGISHEHDMDELGNILCPDVALILNVGDGHTEGLLDKGVAYYKARLLSYLSPNGYGLINADYKDLVNESKVYKNRVNYFGTESDLSNIKCKYISQECDNNLGKFEVRINNEKFEIFAPFHGQSGAENVSAIVAITKSLNIDIKIIQKEFRNIILPEKRFNRCIVNNWEIIDDSYNANPLSMQRMLEVAKEIAKKRPFITVLGEMLELGSLSKIKHHDLGLLLSHISPTAVFWKGGNSDNIYEGLKEGNFKGQFIPFSNEKEFKIALDNVHFNEIKQKNGLIFFKGSRGNHLEIFCKYFLEQCLKEKCSVL